MDFGASVRKFAFGALAVSSVLAGSSVPGHAQAATTQKPNIVVIMGDDIGWMQPSIYHRGLMVGETPNIDRIGNEGAIFMDYLAMQSCTSGRNAFFTGMYPLRTGMIPPQLPGSPSYLRPGTPAMAVFLRDLGYTTGEFGKNHLGDHTASLPTAHGFQEYWGWLYHLDAMQQVSFPDINSSPLVQAVAPPCKNTPVPGLSDPPGAIDPKTGTCLTPPRPVIWCHSSDGTEKNQTLQGRGPADAGAVEDSGRGNLGQGHRLHGPQRPQEDRQAVLRVVQPRAYARHHRAVAEIRRHDWHEGWQGLGHQRSRHEADGRQHRLRASRSWKQMGQLDNTILIFTTDNGAETVTYPDGGITPFKGQKGEAWEGGYRSPLVVRWPGHIKPGTVKKEMFAALDWVPTFVDIAGGPKGDDLNKQIQAGKYPGIVKTMLDGFDQRAYLEGTSEHSARDYFFYYSGATPSAVRWKNWKFYYEMSENGATGWFLPLVNYHWTQVDNVKRDPFEQAMGFNAAKTGAALGGQLGSPCCAYLYDWNLLPIGQLLWEKELYSFKEFPPLQAPETYNLDGILKQMEKNKGDD